MSRRFILHSIHKLLNTGLLACFSTVVLADSDNTRRQQFVRAMQELADNELVVLNSTNSPRATVSVFVDTACTFNKSLHQQLQKLVENRIKVRYIAFPRAGRNSADYPQLQSIWCHQDRAHALNTAYQNEPVTTTHCSPPLDAHQQLAAMLNIRTTPFIVFEDGQTVQGYQTALALLDYIDYGTQPTDSAAFCWAQETPQPFSPIRRLLREELNTLGLNGGIFDSIDILPAPLVDMYEADVGPYRFVLNKDGDFAMRSNILDNDTNELEKRIIRQQAMALLDEQSTIVFPAHGQSRETITVFTDSDCPFCAKMHEDINRLNAAGITVRYLAFPREGIDSESYWKMVSVWCQSNKAKALKQALQNAPLSMQSCHNQPVDWQYQLGVSLGVWGTPTVILQDGRMKVGYTPPGKLLAEVQP